MHELFIPNYLADKYILPTFAEKNDNMVHSLLIKRNILIAIVSTLLLTACASSRVTDAGYNGIDVSHYQGNINWSKVAANRNIEFVYIKASEGANFKDKYRTTYAREAHQQKLKVGFYHFYKIGVNGADQFDNYLKAIKGLPCDLIPVLDIEIEPKASEKTKFESGIKTFCRLCKKRLGTKPIIYTMPNFDKKHLHFLRKYKKWYCGRINDNAIMKKCVIWQVAIKPVSGIYGNVDWDFCPKMRKIKN